MRVFYYSHLEMKILRRGRAVQYHWTIHYRGESRMKEEKVYIQRTYTTEKNETPRFPAVIRLAQLAQHYATAGV